MRVAYQRLEVLLNKKDVMNNFIASFL